MKYATALLVFLVFTCSNAQRKLDIYFDFDKSNLNEVAVKKINSWINEGINFEVSKIYGFCDWKGSNQYNDTLAVKRVTEVYKYLKAKGFEIQLNTEIRGFGEDFEQSKNQGENRRVTIVYTEKKPEVLPDELVAVPNKSLSEKIKNSKNGDLITLQNIYFFNNSAKTVPKSEPVLYELLCIMVDNPTLIIEIQGHICCKRPNETEVISTARAKAIYNFLIKNKIDRNRMTYKGYGVSRPIHPIPEKNAQEEDENRRVEIKIIRK